MRQVIVPAVRLAPSGIGEDISCAMAAGMECALYCGVVRGAAAAVWSIIRI